MLEAQGLDPKSLENRREVEDEIVNHDSVAGRRCTVAERLRLRAGAAGLVLLPPVSLLSLIPQANMRCLFDCHLGQERLSSGLCRSVWRRAPGVLPGLVGAVAMLKVHSRVRVAICATAIAAFSVTMMIPTPASAWWYHRGWGWHPGWHYGWRGCCSVRKSFSVLFRLRSSMHRPLFPVGFGSRRTGMAPTGFPDIGHNTQARWL